MKMKFYLCSQKVQHTTEDEPCASQPAGTVDHHDPAAAAAADLLTSHRAQCVDEQQLTLEQVQRQQAQSASPQ